MRSPDYNAKLFINTAKSIRKERLNAKLENASICFDPEDEVENSIAIKDKDLP